MLLSFLRLCWNIILYEIFFYMINCLMWWSLQTKKNRNGTQVPLVPVPLVHVDPHSKSWFYKIKKWNSPHLYTGSSRSAQPELFPRGRTGSCILQCRPVLQVLLFPKQCSKSSVPGLNLTRFNYKHNAVYKFQSTGSVPTLIIKNGRQRNTWLVEKERLCAHCMTGS